MKRTFKVLGIIGLILVIGFSFVACGGDDDGGSSGDGDNSGGTVTYPDGIADEDKPTEFDGGWVKATISNGKVDLIFNESVYGSHEPWWYWQDKNGKSAFDDVTVGPSDVKMSQSGNFVSADRKYYLAYIKEDYSAVVGFWYVDKDATMKGTAKPYGTIPSVDNFNISLKKGWNYVVVPAAKNGVRDYKTAYTNLPSGYIWTVMDDSMLEKANDTLKHH